MASILKRGDSYSVRYKYKDHSGKPCEGWESFKTKKEAQERKITVEKELLDGTFLVPDTMTVEEMLYKWIPIQSTKHKWSPKTYTQSVAMVQNLIVPYIGKRKVQELRTYDIEKFYATLAKTPCGQYVHGVKQDLSKKQKKRLLSNTSILQFCKEHKTTVHITTNGSFLSYYLKKFIINRRFISGIYPTIDSMALNYMTRYDLDPSRNNTNETFKLLCCIKTLLHYGIHVDLGTNIDRHNHKEIWNTLDDLKKLQLLQDKNFAWTIGRVDDRLYETNFPDIMMESEILAELQSKPLPDNVHAAFLKTCYNFADKMGLKLNLREHKQTHSYCWSTSSSSNVFYVDMNLKTYRCTCTVGRSRYSLFDFSYENLTNYRPVAVTCNSYAECKDCKIGGFCGGGCQLSHQIDFKKCCTYEEEVFSHFMKTLFIPYIKSKYNEVNQNERKAENRCT